MPSSQTNMQSPDNLTPLRIHAVNYIGLYTLIYREVGRFLAVYTRTIVAPVITTLLYYTIFALAFGGVQHQAVNGISFLRFLAPGLIMMSMVQNAFANTSSSIMISKIQGNIVDVLMPPLSSLELFVGFVTGGVVRGLVVGCVTGSVMSLFVPIHIEHVFHVIVFAVLGCYLLSALGIAAGIWSEKFDHIAAVTNFVVMPMTFLSGTFYSMSKLPELWQGIARLNPFFYMIDGFRSGFIGMGDSAFLHGVVILGAVDVFLTLLALWMLRTGYKIKS